jgi:molybdenum cofactor cytidylyltransferase
VRKLKPRKTGKFKMKKSNSLAIAILAAGTSSRLEGKIKQLLTYKNTSLLKDTVMKALNISDNVFVILGHKKDECEKELEGLNVNIIYNENYKQGMGTSLSFAIKNTINFNHTMIMLCDQPFIPLSHYQTLKDNINKTTIIATQYGDNKSSKVPAIFPKKFYEKLEQLDADFGAKEILKKEKCINIVLESIYSIDIDTIQDTKFLLDLQNK